MCKACNQECCDTDHLAECGCSDCIEPNCWTGWEASQERDPGDEQSTVPGRADLRPPGGRGMMILLACGDRNWTDREVIRVAFASLPTDTVLVHGANGYRGKNGRIYKGADMLCDEVARELGWPEPRPYPARWDLHGNAAGPIRNQEMLDKEKPDRVYAFHDRFEKSRGTKDMARRARKAGILVTLFISWPPGMPEWKRKFMRWRLR